MEALNSEPIHCRNTTTRTCKFLDKKQKKKKITLPQIYWMRSYFYRKLITICIYIYIYHKRIFFYFLLRKTQNIAVNTTDLKLNVYV